MARQGAIGGGYATRRNAEGKDPAGRPATDDIRIIRRREKAAKAERIKALKAVLLANYPYK